MRVVSVENNIATHTCKKCGYTVTAEVPTDTNNNSNSENEAE